MDLNTEGGPPKVDIAEVEVEVDRTVRVQLTRRSMSGRSFIRELIVQPTGPPSQGTRSRPSPPSELESLSSSDIFRNVFRPPPGPPGLSEPIPASRRDMAKEEPRTQSSFSGALGIRQLLRAIADYFRLVVHSRSRRAKKAARGRVPTAAEGRIPASSGSAERCREPFGAYAWFCC